MTPEEQGAVSGERPDRAAEYDPCGEEAQAHMLAARLAWNAENDARRAKGIYGNALAMGFSVGQTGASC